MFPALKNHLKLLSTRHLPSGDPNVFIHSLPRSGSTWLMELILTQPGFLACNEPLNLRKEVVRDHLKVSDWRDLHSSTIKEKLFVYFSGLSSGRIRDPRFSSHRTKHWLPYRPLTRRIVYKIINGGEEHINWFSDTFNGRVLFLIRHPIPVSLSRRYFPKLATLLETDFAQGFSRSQLALAHDIIQGRDTFAHGLLDWCLRNSMALRARTEHWIVLSYEQMVLDPAPAVKLMADRLSLPAPDRIFRNLETPSGSTTLSDRITQAALRTRRDANNKQWLVEKWQEKVSQEQISLAGELLVAFGLNDLYSSSEALPNRSIWL